MAKYLLEIGTEELPYKFIPSAMEQLRSEFEAELKADNLTFSEIKTYATPRRLAVIVEDLPQKQDDTEKVVKGPISNIAYDEQGNLTPAGLGFAKKNGVEAKDLFKQDNYVYAKISQKGLLTSEILSTAVPKIILKLRGSHFMRWADFDVKFQRPIRWLVSLLDSEIVPFQIADIKASNLSRGHRFSAETVEIKSIDTYLDTLRKVNVIADVEERKNEIVKLSKEKARELGAEVILEDDLLEEVTFLTEWPVPVVCSFNEKYLAIPEKVTVTVMAVHQRYFPMYKDGKLLNKYITVSNYVGNTFDNIKAGNERVVTARLEDAIFFFEEDKKKKLADYIEDLKGVTFQKGFGSVYDKSQRMVKLSETISNALNVPFADVKRTAELAKADLVTKLVFEFTELQGYIGSAYAEISGENAKVVKGIKEHYFPLNAESELAEGIEGQIVGIADKLDTVITVFADGKKITGSQDPLGVRRATLGILKTVLQKGLDIDLETLIKQGISLLPVKVEDENKLFETIKEFFEQRLIVLFSEKYNHDVLEAAISNKHVISDLKDFQKRVEIIKEIISKEGYSKFHEGINRIIRIIKSEKQTGNVETALLKTEQEKALFSEAQKIDEKGIDYKSLEEKLLGLIPFITDFFDKVLVMDEDEKVKQNKINLLFMVRAKFDKIADFSKIVF